jgi:hypothetical protein
MKIQQFLQATIRQLRGDPKLTDTALHNLIKRLESTLDVELSCDEVFALVDDYAEAELQGQDVAHLKPLIRHHLDMCRECEEEYEALLQVLEGSPGGLE